MKACPVKSKQWLQLVDKIGHQGAYKMWATNNYKVPNVVRDLRIRFNVPLEGNEYQDLKQRLDQYNNRLGTGHKLKLYSTPKVLYVTAVEENWNTAGIKSVAPASTEDSYTESLPTFIERQLMKDTMARNMEANQFITDEGDVLSWDDFLGTLENNSRSSVDYLPVDVDDYGVPIISNEGDTPIVSEMFLSLRQLPFKDEELYTLYSKLVELSEKMNTVAKDEHGELLVYFSGTNDDDFNTSLVKALRNQTANEIRVAVRDVQPGTEGKFIQVATWSNSDFDSMPINTDDDNIENLMNNAANQEPLIVPDATVDDLEMYEDEAAVFNMSNMNAKSMPDKDYRFKILVDTLYYARREIRKAEYIANKNGRLQDAQRYAIRRTQLEEQIEVFKAELSRPSELFQLHEFAMDHLNQVDNLINSDNPHRLPLEELLYARRLLNFWASSMENLPTEAERNDPLIMRPSVDATGMYEVGFEYYQNRANNLDRKLAEIERLWLTDYINATQRKDDNNKYDVKSLFTPFSDTDSWDANVLDPLAMENVIVQTFGKVALVAGQKVHEDISNFEKEVDALYSKVLPTLKKFKRKGDSVFGIFKQRDKFGNITGDIIQEFMPEAWEERKKARKQLYDYKNPKTYHTYQQWHRTQWIMADVRKLFYNIVGDAYQETNSLTGEVIQFTEQDRLDHIAELELQYGKETTEEILESLERKVNQFLELRKEIVESYSTNTAFSEEDNQLSLRIWDIENSPFWAAKDFYDEVDVERTYLNLKTYKAGATKRLFPQGAREYGYLRPRRVTPDGKETGWMNKDFQVIRNNKDLLEFYRFTLNKLDRFKRHLPYDVQKRIQYNTLPTMRKSVTEKLLENGVLSGAAAFMDKIIASTRTDDISPVYYGDLDPLTQSQELALEVRYLPDHAEQIKDVVHQMLVDFKLQNSREPNEAELERIRSNAKTYIAENKSWDLPRILKAYGMMSYTFKHKTQVADELKFIRNQMARLAGPAVNQAGIPLTTPDGTLIVPKDNLLKNYLSAMDFHLKQFFGKNKVQMQTNINVLTSNERTEKKDLENLRKSVEDNKSNFDEAEYKETLELIDRRLSNLGGKVVGSRVIDKLLNYMQLKTLGWNPFSAFSNFSFGQTALLVEASSGEHFDDKELASAMKVALKSVGKFWTKGRFFKDDETLMLRALMEKFRFPSKSFRESSTTPFEGNQYSTSIFNPFTLTESTEYLNYAPALLATIRKKMVKVTIDGAEVEIPLIQGFKLDEVKGAVWDTDKYGPEPTEAISDYAVYISALEGKIHGNYDPLRRQAIKEGVGGRMLSMFRTWIMEGANARWFAKERFDESLGKTFKARYRSFPALHRATGGGLPMTLYIGKQLLNKWAAVLRIKSGRVTDFDKLVGSNGFSEVDAANMRRNMSELFTYMNIIGLYLMLKYGMGDDEEDEDLWVYNMLLNQMFRLQQDMNFYVSLSSVEQLNKNIIPITGLYNDVSAWFGALGDTIIGEGEYETGTFAGSSKLLKATASILPMAELPYKVKSLSETLLDK